MSLEGRKILIDGKCVSIIAIAEVMRARTPESLTRELAALYVKEIRQYCNRIMKCFPKEE